MKLTPVAEHFILHWGEMGARWGINRTVAQIHALLHLSEQPLHAEEISHALSVARSNVSTSLRELQSWGIVRTVHVLGDRRDHFESIEDVWELFRVIVDERKKREIDPTLSMLRECVMEAGSTRASNYEQKRLADMLDFFESISAWYTQVSKLPPKGVVQFLKAGKRLPKLFGLQR